MNKKFLLSIAFTILISSLGFSQKIKLKKGKVLVDGKEILNYQKRGLGTELILYSLDSKDEIVNMFQENNGTHSYLDDDYKKMFFTKDEIWVESSRVSTRGWKYMIKLLLENNVLDNEGSINSKNLKKFAKKYDENITNRTVRF
ncbi:hypothetical protein [Tenacibaculum singaporense]|uniref:hypothetical protein n=1 Tax=Tenacibaculum singaporense TaxID=2358479 RepID=UPI000F66256F|nr:hypothetical protein [Tenacibaculum singaporense]RSC93440.1 hypothetical protein EI424_09495 [Tenacibaculum singaporense]